jgi:hypothetical protein
VVVSSTPSILSRGLDAWLLDQEVAKVRHETKGGRHSILLNGFCVLVVEGADDLNYVHHIGLNLNLHADDNEVWQLCGPIPDSH